MMRSIRRLARAVVLVGVVGFLYVALTTFEVWRVGRFSDARQAGAIVVMGAAQYDGRPSPQLAARLDHAADLWKSGAAPIMVVTGGNQPGDRFTEADASREYLVDVGVPAGAIREENSSHSTWEAFDNLRRLVDADAALGAITNIVIVTDPYHSLRSRLIAESAGFDAVTSSTDSSPVKGSRAATKHLKEAVGIAVGRIIGFELLWKVTG